MASTKQRRILLIQCGPSPEEASLERFCADPGGGLTRYDAPVVPISCATIAALTPDTYEVDIWDENILGQIGPETPLPPCDVIGVSLTFSSLTRHARALGQIFKERGALVVAGGPGISAAPEEFRDAFDVLFVNEAERTWPEFLRDLERGQVRPEYRQIDRPSLAESPRPDFRAVLAHMPRYQMGAVQTTRGCPFDCDFCDVIYLYGRRQRHKPVDQVLDEIQALALSGSRGIFITDDELVGDAAYAKALLSGIVSMNGARPRPLWFHTQLTLNLGRDETLLALVADANFYSALVGIESFDKDSLEEVGKHHHAVRDIMRDVDLIHAHGIGLLGSLIVGFDHDGPGVFDRLYENVQRACLPMVLLHLLSALPNTRLWARLRTEGRVATVRLRRKEEPPGLMLNVTPLGMSRVELIEGFRGLCDRVYTWDAIMARLRGWISGVRRPPAVREEPLGDAWRDRFLAEAACAFGLSEGERDGLGDTLSHAARTAPFLLPRLAYFLGENHYLRQHIQSLFVGYERMIALERRGELIEDDAPIVLPPSFGPAVTGLFEELFTRLARGLPDERLIPEAMKHVFVDFILRWGATFQKLEPEHHAFLLDLCDKATEQLGGQPAGAPRRHEALLLHDARRGRLLDAVLKDVRDELAAMAA